MTLLLVLSILAPGHPWTGVSVQDLLRTYAFAGIPCGLLAGMALGLLARPRGGVAGRTSAAVWEDYASFGRRSLRLAHVAAVMLPALAGLFALLLVGPRSESAAAVWGARLWVAGGTSLPLALVLAAFRPRRAAFVVGPALLLVAASCAFAAAGLAGGAP